MNEAYNSLTERFRKLSRIEHAISYLNWDQMVVMPPKGMQARADSIAELAGIHHQQMTAPELGELMAKADENLPDDHRANLQEMEKLWRQETCLPAELVKARIVAGSRCEHAWRTQKAENDWAGFLGNFREVVELSREEAQLRQAADSAFDTPYDALLDLHCSGDSKALIDSVFGRLRNELPSLLNEITEKQRQQGRKSTLPDHTYDTASQKRLSESLMAMLGFDFEGGRLDESMHPFSMGDAGDSRITTRYSEDEFLESLMATAHETGHASYESGLPAKWANLPIGKYRNMCIHESQSLLFEKQIFLSKAFMSGFTPNIQQAFDTRAFDSQALWQVATHVQPGYIRVEADEVTYPLHVLLRYEIESDLINGDIEAHMIPELWNTKMQEFLGLEVGNEHSKGCMQDIHWTDGAFGYFPSYTLGAVNGAQLFATIKTDFPDWQDKLAAGDITFIREWLAEKIWSKGRFLSSQALMRQATGEGTAPESYLEHLRARYLREEY